MKKTLLFSLVALLSMGAYAQTKAKAKAKPLKPVTGLQTKTDSLSYALGQSLTNGLKQHLVSTGVLEDSTSANFNAKEYQYNLEVFTQGLIAAFKAASAKENKYNAGIAVGNQLTTISEKFETEMLNGEKLNKDVFLHSIVGAINEEKTMMENAETYLQEVASQLQEAAQFKAAEELKVLHGERITEGVRFLAENKMKEGVTTLASGLQYVVTEKGTGAMPTTEDQVTVHYEGRLLDGTVFDSSYKRGEPATFGVGQVIAGWTEVLQLMPEGSKWTVYIPYDLAYGERDSGSIPPFSTLVFDIELIKIAE